MIKLLLTLILMFVSTSINSQVYETVDMLKIKKAISDENSPYFYPTLYSRYSDNDTSLNLVEYRHLYYGHALQPYFNPNLSKRNDSMLALRKYLNAGEVDFKRVIEMANFVLRLDPFYIDGIYMLSIAYDKIGDRVNTALWIDKYSKIIRTIWYSGNGQTPETAFTVLSTADEYSLLESMKVKYKERSPVQINGKPYDLIRVEPNEKGYETIYFDIELFYGKDLQYNNK